MTAFYTPDDLTRYRGQKRLILRALAEPSPTDHVLTWWHVRDLEIFSGAKRVASRIDELRNDWRIQTRKNPVTKRAMYKLIRKLTEARERKAHCETCTCHEEHWTGPEPPNPSHDLVGKIDMKAKKTFHIETNKFPVSEFTDLPPEQARLL